MDDVRPLIESIDWLSESDKKKIFEENAKEVLKLDLKEARRDGPVPSPGVGGIRHPRGGALRTTQDENTG